VATNAYKSHIAARSSTGRQIEQYSAHFPQQVEEHVAPSFHTPVFARVLAHQLVNSPVDSNTAAPHASVQNKEPPDARDPSMPNMFAGQGAYRARTYVKYGIS